MAVTLRGGIRRGGEAAREDEAHERSTQTGHREAWGEQEVTDMGGGSTPTRDSLLPPNTHTHFSQQGDSRKVLAGAMKLLPRGFS